jgi:hypothetical protein
MLHCSIIEYYPQLIEKVLLRGVRWARLLGVDSPGPEPAWPFLSVETRA